MYKSPFGPPLLPGLPAFGTLNLLPVSTPAGTLTSFVFLSLIVPVPLQVLHLFSNTCPVPEHLEQVVLLTKAPPNTDWVTWPFPLQSGQVFSPNPPFPLHSVQVFDSLIQRLICY